MTLQKIRLTQINWNVPSGEEISTWGDIKTALKGYFDTLYQVILSEGSFESGDKAKLDGIEDGATTVSEGIKYSAGI